MLQPIRIAGRVIVQYSSISLLKNFISLLDITVGGLAHLTHEFNYKAMGNIFRIDLVNNPVLALTPDISAQILVYGMMKGSFTTAPLSRYINSSKVDFINARRVVNGLDKASEIAENANNIALNVMLLTQAV